MKPRTTFQRMVASANEHLQPISQKQIDWAFRNVATHIAFHSKGTNVCSDCGEKFDQDPKGKRTIRCPHCGARLNVLASRQRKVNYGFYFSVLDVKEGMQVQRIFQLIVSYEKGKEAVYDTLEVVRIWHDGNGRRVITARNRAALYYADRFIEDSPITLKQDCNQYTYMVDSKIAAGAKILPIYRKYGISGRFPNVNPDLLFRHITDPRIETLLKIGRIKDLNYFLCNMSRLDVVWAAYKITLRRNYHIEDISIWADLISSLIRCGKDIRNFHYVCPDNLRAAHDYWQVQKKKILDKEWKEKEYAEAQKQEADFIRLKSKFFDLVISDGEIEISVLDSIKAFKEEGEAMHHCVYSCKYYNQKDSLIMSARIGGQRIETIELSLSSLRIIQSRAVCNGISDYHDRILNLVKSNLPRIAERLTA